MATETTLRPGEIKDILLREIEAADFHELDVEEVGTVLEVKDGIARIYGLQKAMAGEMLEITSSETANKVIALALNLEEDNIGAVVLGDYLQLKEGDEVSALIINVDRKARSIQLSIKAKDNADQQEAMQRLSQSNERETAGTTSLGALLRAKLDNKPE